MYGVTDTDERFGLNNARSVIAAGFRGQHAVDAWESEGGSVATVRDGRDLALAENPGWQASNNAGWLANSPLRRMSRERPPADALKRGSRIAHKTEG